MDSLFSILVNVALGYAIWQLIKIGVNFWHQSRGDLEFEQRFRDHLEQIIHVVKQEQQGDMYYWYDNDSEDFLAQGRTWEDIVDVLRSRFPDHIFVLNTREMIMGPEFEVIEFEPGTKLTVKI
jgi:hypothetical protein